MLGVSKDAGRFRAYLRIDRERDLIGLIFYTPELVDYSVKQA